MAEKKTNVPLTVPEIRHLLRLLEDNERDGSYYGNRQQHWKRHTRIKVRLWLHIPEEPTDEE